MAKKEQKPARYVSPRPSARTAQRDAKEAAKRPYRVIRGFDAGQTGRRLKAIPSSLTAINTQIRNYGKTVLARSRYLATNHPYTVAAKEAFTSALVGCGIKPSWLYSRDETIKAALQEAWLRWTDEADADGVYDFYGLQTIVADELFEAGEVFVRFRERMARDGLSVPLQLQILPAEMVPTEYNAMNGRNTINMGIEFDPIGRRVAYWCYKSHPGEQWTGLNGINTRELVRVPAEEIIHVFKPTRAGAIRGVPRTLASMVTAAILDLYEDAELERKRTAALFGAFTVATDKTQETENDLPFESVTEYETNADGTPNFGLEPGATVDLPEGRDIRFSEPADVGGSYEPFLFRQLSRMAAGFGVPYVDMTGDLRQVNYSSDRSGLVRFRRKMEALQHNIMVFQFCRVVAARWLRAAVRAQAVRGLSASRFLAEESEFNRIKWIPPKWDWVDPLKDRQAEKLAVDSGFKSRSDVVESEGYDIEEVDARIAADQQRAKKYNIQFIQLPSSIVVAPGEESTILDDAITPGGSADDSEFG